MVLSRCDNIRSNFGLKEHDIKKEIKNSDDDDDWGAVPAFLRRSKLK